MRSLDSVAQEYGWKPNKFHYALVGFVPVMAIHGIFSTALFNTYGKSKLFVVLAELHTYEAAKKWLDGLQRAFPDRKVEIHPPFIRDRVKNQYRGRSKVYKGWTPQKRPAKLSKADKEEQQIRIADMLEATGSIIRPIS